MSSSGPRFGLTDRLNGCFSGVGAKNSGWNRWAGNPHARWCGDWGRKPPAIRLGSRAFNTMLVKIRFYTSHTGCGYRNKNQGPQSALKNVVIMRLGTLVQNVQKRMLRHGSPHIKHFSLSEWTRFKRKPAIFGFARYPRSPLQAAGECVRFCGSSGYDADCSTLPRTRLCFYNDFYVPTKVV